MLDCSALNVIEWSAAWTENRPKPSSRRIAWIRSTICLFMTPSSLRQDGDSHVLIGIFGKSAAGLRTGPRQKVEVAEGECRREGQGRVQDRLHGCHPRRHAGVELPVDGASAERATPVVVVAPTIDITLDVSAPVKVDNQVIGDVAISVRAIPRRADMEV